MRFFVSAFATFSSILTGLSAFVITFQIFKFELHPAFSILVFSYKQLADLVSWPFSLFIEFSGDLEKSLFVFYLIFAAIMVRSFFLVAARHRSVGPSYIYDGRLSIVIFFIAGCYFFVFDAQRELGVTWFLVNMMFVWGSIEAIRLGVADVESKHKRYKSVRKFLSGLLYVLFALAWVVAICYTTFAGYSEGSQYNAITTGRWLIGFSLFMYVTAIAEGILENLKVTDTGMRASAADFIYIFFSSWLALLVLFLINFCLLNFVGYAI